MPDAARDYSTKLIIGEFHPTRIAAFDLMPEQIKIARTRRLDANFQVGDATRIESADACVDAVFIFGVLHHILAWKKALEEMSQVLKPEGVLLLEEPHFAYKFDWPEFEIGIEGTGFSILERKHWLMGYFRSYLCRKKA